MIFEKVQKIMADQFEVDEAKINLDTDIVSDLGADSLDMADLAMSFEDEFEIEVPDEIIEDIKTVGDIVKYLEENCD